MQDVKLENLELFYDCLDESNNFLFTKFNKTYFELIEMTVNNILAGEILTDFEDPNDAAELQKIYDKIADVDFSVEDVRKAMQSIVLRGFKEMNIPNGNTTPDTLGIFITYLITKILPQKEISIVDPLCGTGNLLITIANHIDKELKLYGCDKDLWMTKLTSLTADLVQTPVELFYQDTMSLALKDMDAVVFDMPHSEDKEKYFPYEAMLHYTSFLKDNGCMIGIVENDFFEHDKKSSFKNELLKTMSILGIIELPDNMFKAVKPKLILVLQKRIMKDTKCFMVKLPSFTDVKEFNSSLIDIEQWFEKNN